MSNLPTLSKTWTPSSFNNRVTYVSLNDAMKNYLYLVKTTAVAAGFTTKYTCDGTTGPTSSSDHTDRWASAANASTRGAASGNAQSFWVGTSLGGWDVMLTYQGATDDVARISFSPTGVFLPAGTANQQPTATDEQVVVSGTTLIGTTTSGDRIVNVWVDSTARMLRGNVFRAGVCVGGAWGVELCTSVAASPASFSPAVYGWFQLATNLTGSGSYATTYASNSKGWVGVVNGSVSNVSATGAYGLVSHAYVTITGGVSLESQGSNGPLIQDMLIGSGTTNARGPWGNVIDRWFSNESQPDGAMFGSNQFILLTGSGTNQNGMMLPWLSGSGASVTT